MKTFTMKTEYGSYEASITVNSYFSYGNIAISIIVKNDELGCFEPWNSLTTNIVRLPTAYACIDTNNNPNAETLISELGIGKPTGQMVSSGFCQYPVYKMDLDVLEKYDKQGVDMFKENV